MEDVRKQSGLMQAAYLRAPRTSAEAEAGLRALREQLEALDLAVNGSKARDEVGEKQARHSIREYFRVASSGGGVLTYGPTATQRECFGHAERLLAEAEEQLQQTSRQMEELSKQLRELGAPGY
jgi:hypothetical protein